MTLRPTAGGTSSPARRAGGWCPAGVEFSYRWYRDGLLLTRELGNAYRLGPADVGGMITVRVHGEQDGYNPATSESAPVGPVLARERR